MPKKLLRRFTPDPQKLKESKHLKFLGHRLHNPNLWHVNRHSVTRAVTIGLFITFLPTPLHTLTAAIVAFFLAANLPVAIVAVWFVNPFMVPAVFYIAYKIGAHILNIPPQTIHFELSFQFLTQGLLEIWAPLLLGCLLMATVAAVLGNFLVRIIWRCFVVREWRERKQRRII